MVFVKKDWKYGRAGRTPVTDDELDRIESGIEEAHTRLTALTPASIGALDVTQLGVMVAGVGDGVANDTTALQVALTAGAGGVVRGRPGKTYLVSAPLVIPSGTTLDMTGCTIRLKAGSNCNLLNNAAVAATGTRDSNITIIGGTWDKGANGGVGVGNHYLRFRRADGIKLVGLTIKGTAGKYAVSLGDVTRYLVDDIDFSVFSDAVHVNGPASGGTISNLRGTAGDDAVGLTATDYVDYNDVTGPISDVWVENVQVANDDALLKITSGTGTYVQGVTARGLWQTGTGRSVYLNNDTGPLDARDIHIEDIVGRVQIAPGTVTDMTFRGVRFVPTVNNGVWLDINGTTINHLSIHGARCDSSFTGNHAVILSGTANIKNLTLDDVHWRGPSSYLVQFQGATQTVTWLKGSNVYRDGVNNSGGLVNTASGGTLTYVELANIVQENDAWVADLKSALTLSLSNVKSRGGINLRDTASVVVRGAGIDFGASAITGTTTFRSRGDLPVDVSKLTKTANDTAFNTNAALACGAGPVVCDGTSWKHLHSGLTY